MKSKFKAYELAVELYHECGPLKLKRTMKDQLERATLSIVLNLAEGAAKPTKPDKHRFFAIAYGSIRETQAVLRLIDNKDLFAKADALGGATWRLMQSMH